jgi:hypothetical protein
MWGKALGLQYEPLPYLKFLWSSLCCGTLWFLKNSPSLYNKNFILWPPNIEDGGRPKALTGRRSQETPVCTFLSASPVDLLVGPQGADRKQLKSGVGIPEMNQKDEPSTGYLIRRRSRAIGGEGFHIERIVLSKIVAFKRTISKFLNTVAVHIEGTRHHPIRLFDTLVSCQCPFNMLSRTSKFQSRRRCMSRSRYKISLINIGCNN